MAGDIAKWSDFFHKSTEVVAMNLFPWSLHFMWSICRFMNVTVENHLYYKLFLFFVSNHYLLKDHASNEKFSIL